MRKHRHRAKMYAALHLDAHAAWARLYRAIGQYLDGTIDRQELERVYHTPHRSSAIKLD